MLRGKQKRFLRSQAHHLRPAFQVGKDGLNAAWLDGVLASLNKNELLKVSLLQNCLLEPAEVKEWVEKNSDIEVVQIIGHVLVLYCRSSKLKYRDLSNQVAQLAR